MNTYRYKESNPDNQIHYVYDFKYNLLGEFEGRKKTMDFLGVEINDRRLSTNSKKNKIDGKYYVTKESFFTQNLFI